MATKKKGRLTKAFAKKATAARPAFKASGPGRSGGPGKARPGGKPGHKPGGLGKVKPGGARGSQAARAVTPDRKLPRKHGARRKTPRSIGREAAPPVPKVQAGPPLPDLSRELAVAIARAGLDKKAQDVVVFDVRGLSSYADYLVIMTSESDRQSGAIADHVDEQLKAAGHTKVGVEGYQTGTWIIVDYGDVVAHVFGKEARGFYDLEGLWADAPRFPVEG